MRKYGKWVLTLSLLAATPGMTFAAGSKAKDATARKSSQPDNQRVAEEIASALKASKIEGKNITIEFRDGTAVVAGTVTDARVKKTVTTVIEGIAGVNKVDNRITVAEKKGVAERTRASEKGSVVQAGHAGDSAPRKRVQQVNNEFPDLPSPGAPAQAGSSNQETAEQIAAALSAARLDGYDIQIRFQNGVAVLEGSVGTPAERNAVSQVASSVPGVQVVNRLRCTEERPAQYADAGAAGPGAARSPYGYQQPRGDIRGAGYMQPGAQPPAPGMGAGPMGAAPMGPMGPGAPPYPPSYGHPGMGASQAVYNSPNMPDYAWPSYAQYPNSAAVSYPQQYSASAWPYIGPFYPYPQVPLGWRDATLRWDDGQWNLMFRPRTDRWWWFMNPNNW